MALFGFENFFTRLVGLTRISSYSNLSGAFKGEVKLRNFNRFYS